MSEEDIIAENILSVCEIECSNCDKVGGEYCMDEFDAANEFIKKGWRGTKHNNIYCPECSKIKLTTSMFSSSFCKVRL